MGVDVSVRRDWSPLHLKRRAIAMLAKTIGIYNNPSNNNDTSADANDNAKDSNSNATAGGAPDDSNDSANTTVPTLSALYSHLPSMDQLYIRRCVLKGNSMVPDLLLSHQVEEVDTSNPSETSTTPTNTSSSTTSTSAADTAITADTNATSPTSPSSVPSAPSLSSMALVSGLTIRLETCPYAALTCQGSTAILPYSTDTWNILLSNSNIGNRFSSNSNDVNATEVNDGSMNEGNKRKKNNKNTNNKDNSKDGQDNKIPVYFIELITSVADDPTHPDEHGNPTVTPSIPFGSSGGRGGSGPISNYVPSGTRLFNDDDDEGFVGMMISSTLTVKQVKIAILEMMQKRFTLRYSKNNHGDNAYNTSTGNDGDTKDNSSYYWNILFNKDESDFTLYRSNADLRSPQKPMNNEDIPIHQMKLTPVSINFNLIDDMRLPYSSTYNICKCTTLANIHILSLTVSYNSLLLSYPLNYYRVMVFGFN